METGGVETLVRGRELRYRASACAGPFRLLTGYFKEHKQAAEHLALLQKVSQEVGCRGAAGSFLDEAVECRFREAIADLGMAQAMTSQIRFFATVPAKYWIGRQLKTPCLLLPEGLQAGLDAWRKLRNARSSVYCGPCDPLQRGHLAEEMEAAWQTLRGAYSEVWSTVGNLAPERLAAKLLHLEELRGACSERRRACWELQKAKSPVAAATCCGPASQAKAKSAERRVLNLLASWARREAAAARRAQRADAVRAGKRKRT